MRNGGSIYKLYPSWEGYNLYILPPFLINAFQAFSETITFFDEMWDLLYFIIVTLHRIICASCAHAKITHAHVTATVRPQLSEPSII